MDPRYLLATGGSGGRWRVAFGAMSTNLSEWESSSIEYGFDSELSRDGDDSEMLDRVLMEHSKYKVQIAGIKPNLNP